MKLVHIHYDPFDKFKEQEPRLLIYLCNVILQWAHISVESDVSMKEVISEHYGYGLHPFGEEGSVDKDGVYTYPGDPDLYPISIISTPKEIIFCYMHEIIAIRNRESNEELVLRVD